MISAVLYAGELGPEGLDIESQLPREEVLDCSNELSGNEPPSLPEFCHYRVALVQRGKLSFE